MGLFQGDAKTIQKLSAIGIILENSSPFNASRYHMIESTRDVQPLMPGHVLNLENHRRCVN
jgi:hypothetical protein